MTNDSHREKSPLRFASTKIANTKIEKERDGLFLRHFCAPTLLCRKKWSCKDQSIVDWAEYKVKRLYYGLATNKSGQRRTYDYQCYCAITCYFDLTHGNSSRKCDRFPYTTYVQLHALLYNRLLELGLTEKPVFLFQVTFRRHLNAKHHGLLLPVYPRVFYCSL